MNRLLLSILLAAHVLALSELHAQSDASSSSATQSAGGQVKTDHSTMIDHQRFTQLLQLYVTPAGLVDYAALQSAPAMLTEYLHSLSEVDQAVLSAQNDAVQIAFWINAYNALTLKLIIDHYPIPAGGAFGGLFGGGQSITDIDGAWDELQWTVAGKQRTLDDIEHNILRKNFDEPRIHFAIVCASLSCPDLRREAYNGTRLDRQLQEQTLRFLNNPNKGLNINRRRDRVRVSSIFDWFDEDFDCTDEPLQIAARLSSKRRSVACFIASQLLPSDPRHEYLLQQDYGLRFLDYDWSLNQQQP